MRGKFYTLKICSYSNHAHNSMIHEACNTIDIHQSNLLHVLLYHGGLAKNECKKFIILRSSGRLSNIH